MSQAHSPESMAPRSAVVWSLLRFLLLLLTLCTTQEVVCAQDEEEETEQTATTPASTEDEGGETKAEEKSVLWWLIETSGWIGAILLVLSIYFVAKTVQMFMELRPEIVMPPELVAETDALLKNKDFMGAYKRLKSDPSFFGTVLSAGIAELPHGLPEARETMDRVADANIVEMERQISMLAVLGSLGPMIGLLGTLKGMIASFGTIALSDTQMKASEVAGGISEALVLTFEGVGLSVPAIYFFAVFRNRVSSLSTRTLLAADEYLRSIHASMRSKTPAAPAGAAPAAPAAPRAS